MVQILTVPLSVYFCKQCLQKLRHLCYRGTSFPPYSPLIKIRALCYQPPCHICFHLSIVFKFVAATVCFSARIRWLSIGDKSAGIITVSVCALVTELHVMQTYFVSGACI